MAKSVRGAPPRPGDALYMTTAHAAETLGVSIATLYTYVSRKNIRAHKVPGSRSSRYLRADIERLKKGLTTEARRELASGLASSSSVTLVSESGSYYRGVSAIELSKHGTLEDAARLLWDTGEDDPFAQPPASVPAHLDRLIELTRAFDPLDRLSMLLPALETANPRAYDLGRQGFCRSAAEVLRWATAIFLDRNRPTAEPIHRTIAAKSRCGAPWEDVLRRVLVLGADQALHPTTYAVRATANTGATPYRCVLAGLAAVSGKRLPSVRTASFARFIKEIEEARDATEPVRVRMRENEDLPGFGFSPFETADPRAIALWSALEQRLASDRRFKHFDRAIRFGRDATGQPPDFSFLAAYVSHRVGLGPRANLVRLARLVGWLAHALEQQLDKPMLRWRVAYTGRLPLET